MRTGGDMNGTDRRTFVIADIHGCYSTFCALLDQIMLTREDELYLLGDYIDRGPDSKEVVDLIMQLQADGFAVKPIMGNHEQMLLDSIEPTTLQKKKDWILNGGLATLLSYGALKPDDLPEEHIAFFRALPMYIATDSHIFVHGALDMTLREPFGRKGRDAMLWDRECSGNLKKLKGKTVVSGHTPRGLEEIRNSLHSPHVRIDNGCFWGLAFPDMGNLIAWELTSGELILQPCIPHDASLQVE